MNELEPRIHDETSELNYVLVGDCHIPAIKLPESDDRSIGKQGWIRAMNSIVSCAEGIIRSGIINA